MRQRSRVDFIAHSRMGIYWKTVLCHGRLCHEEPQQDPRWTVERLDARTWIVHDCVVTMATMDPILEEHEIARGWVDAKEIHAWLERRPDVKLRWDDDIADFGLWIIQYMYTTLDPENCDKIFQHALPVVSPNKTL